MKKIVSFSLWGDSKLYCQGALDNVEAVRRHYPGWIPRFYVAGNCPVLRTLWDMPGVEVVEMPPHEGILDKGTGHWQTDYDGMLWRFLAIDDPGVERVVFRDTDSRVGPVDAECVRQWEESGVTLQVMHETMQQRECGPAMGGMWGVVTDRFPPHFIERTIRQFVRVYSRYNQPWVFCDLIYIRDVVFPYLRKRGYADALCHGADHRNALPLGDATVSAVVHEEWRNEKYVS